MKILAIETSCDDTGIAVLEVKDKKYRLLANVVSSQVEIHAPYGGVVPNLASRAHTENLLPCLNQAMEESRTIIKEIDLIAVTYGPGLSPSLLIGVNAARALAYFLSKPLVAVNHIEGHIFTNWLKAVGDEGDLNTIRDNLPAICLVVSGGHTQLVLVKGIGDYKIIGETRDDAAGEAFDKVARLLNLGYPGGPIIAQRAIAGDSSAIELPRPMIKTKDLDFSFSGLKTAVLYETKKSLKTLKDKKYVNNLCAAFQQAVIDVLAVKTMRAVKDYNVNNLMLSGGVAANELLRQRLAADAERIGIKFLAPAQNFCMDNAAMIALAGYFKQANVQDWRTLTADANLRLTN